MISRICNFIARWIGAVVLLAALLSLAFPALCNHIEMRTINPMLGIIMFGMGLTLAPADFRVVFSRPIDVLLGCLVQFVAMPLLALLLVKLFALPVFRHSHPGAHPEEVAFFFFAVQACLLFSVPHQ